MDGVNSDSDVAVKFNFAKMETSKEAVVQWISAVFDSSITEFQVLCLASPLVAASTLHALLGAEKANVFLKFNEVDEEYESFFKEHPFSEENNSKQIALKDKLVGVMEQACHVVRESPDVLEKFPRDETISNTAWFHIVTSIVEYFGLVKKKLHNITEDDGIPDSEIQQLTETRKSLSVKKLELQSSLRVQKDKQADAIERANTKIRKLEQEIELLTNLTTENEKNVQENKETQLKLHHEQHDNEAETLRKNIGLHNVEMDSSRQKHQEDEEAMKKKSKISERELDVMISDFDAQMLNLTDEIQKLHSLLSGEKETLKNVKEKVESLVSEREIYTKQKEKEQKIATEKEALRLEASGIIRTVWRQYKLKLELAKKKAKKNKKKKK